MALKLIREKGFQTVDLTDLVEVRDGEDPRSKFSTTSQVRMLCKAAFGLGFTKIFIEDQKIEFESMPLKEKLRVGTG
jgi:hypothetical protein